MESEFFGHKKGSFTGAVADKQGLFQQANGGTLFLDEVADLPLAMQVKLLRAIQEKTVRAIGDTKEVPVDIRILSATHKDLSQLVQDGAFRQDLYYRINVIELKLPTLNARRDDIPVLAEHFLAMITNEWQLETPPSLTNEACERLQHHDFAGNVRELRNILERAVTLAESSHIDVNHLGLTDIDVSHAQILEPALNDKADVSTIEAGEKNIQQVNDVIAPQIQQVPTNLHPYRTSTQHFPAMRQRSSVNQTEILNSTTSLSDDEFIEPDSTQQESNVKVNLSELSDGQLPVQGLETYLQEQEKQLIITALKKTGWNKTQAAELLGTTFRSLRYRMKKLEISEDESES
jgi:two-component system response regulator PilR (NtrC family)